MNKNFHDLCVRDFIEKFKKYSGDEKVLEDLFSFGYCYHFSIILKDLFNGCIMYNPVENHFATKIYVETSWYANNDEKEYRLYDITGRLDLNDEWVEWTSYEEEEPLGSERIKEQCLYKL